MLCRYETLFWYLKYGALSGTNVSQSVSQRAITRIRVTLQFARNADVYSILGKLDQSLKLVIIIPPVLLAHT
jgi:hypothetical protein